MFTSISTTIFLGRWRGRDGCWAVVVVGIFRYFNLQQKFFINKDDNQSNFSTNDNISRIKILIFREDLR